MPIPSTFWQKVWSLPSQEPRHVANSPLTPYYIDDNRRRATAVAFAQSIPNRSSPMDPAYTARQLHRALPAHPPPSAHLPVPNWIHEIKHDGYRLMARRDPVGIRLLTRNGHDWSPRYPLIVEAVNQLKVRSCLIDGEAVCCDEHGLAVFDGCAGDSEEGRRFLYAFDLLELDGQDLRREPLETRKATLASVLRGSLPGRAAQRAP